MQCKAGRRWTYLQVRKHEDSTQTTSHVCLHRTQHMPKLRWIVNASGHKLLDAAAHQRVFSRSRVACSSSSSSNRSCCFFCKSPTLKTNQERKSTQRHPSCALLDVHLAPSAFSLLPCVQNSTVPNRQRRCPPLPHQLPDAVPQKVLASTLTQQQDKKPQK